MSGVHARGAAWFAWGFLAFGASLARADAGWFESGDTLLRLDLQLLNDAGVIALPVTQWPVPRASVAYALANAKEHFATNAAVNNALARVRARVEERAGFRYAVSASAGEPALLRDFSSLGREDGEVAARVAYLNDRYSVTLQASGVSSAGTDDQKLRADGSEATLRLGNWLLSAQTLDRFWGPGHDSSLILSNNARAIPSFVIERAEAREFETPLLHWIGPWRFSFGVGQMENHREDIDSPLFLAWRVTIMPWRKFELGFSRTAEFCGKQLECNLNVFGNLLAGNDNVGVDATPENEPGNQMAGFDMRWSSPVGNLPYAIYGQMIGEDESSYMPVKFLEQFGIEIWHPFADGALLQGWAEYIDTTCSANRSPPRYDCAYNQGRFNMEGYRYRGRVIGHTADRDTEGTTVGASLAQADGTLWSVSSRVMRLNRANGYDPTDTVASDLTWYRSLELGWRGRVFGDALDVTLGAESTETVTTDREIEPFGFVRWTHEFAR